MFVLQVDAAKLPKADSIKALLFPSMLSVEVTETEIRIVSREAFPELPDPSKTMGISQFATMLKGQGGLSSLLTPPATGNGPASGPGMSRPGAGAGAPGGGGSVAPGRPD